MGQSFEARRSWWLAARDRVKAVIEAPDTEIDDIIKSVLKAGRVTDELIARYPLLADRKLSASVEQAISNKSAVRPPHW